MGLFDWDLLARAISRRFQARLPRNGQLSGFAISPKSHVFKWHEVLSLANGGQHRAEDLKQSLHSQREHAAGLSGQLAFKFQRHKMACDSLRGQVQFADQLIFGNR
jgi:hypothetical protein